MKMKQFIIHSQRKGVGIPMKNISLRVCNICLAMLIAVVFLMNVAFCGLFEITSGILVFLILFAFISLWGSFLVEKNLIMIIWIPTIVLFLMGRPIALILSGEHWTYHGAGTIRLYLLLMVFTVLGMSLPKIWRSERMKLKKLSSRPSVQNNRFLAAARKGHAWCKDKFRAACKSKFSVMTSAVAITKEKIRNNSYFSAVITLGYAITFGCYLLTKIAEYIGLQGKSYLDYYLAHDIDLPWIVTFLANFGIHFMCIQLSMVRKKKTVLAILALNVLSTVPVLLIGQRNPFVLSLIFTVVVICLKNNELWKIRVNKKTAMAIVACAVVAVLVLVMGMSFLSSSRNGQESDNVGFFRSVLNFIRDQGNTFEAVCQGIIHRDYLRAQDNSCYTFSAVMDYYTYGQVGNWLFGTTEIPGGNNAERAMMSHDFAHKISYLVLDDNYLKGAGLGTSYVIEVFLNFGLLGVLLVNLFYSVILTKLGAWFGKSLMLDSAFIYVLLKVFFLGRDSALIPFSDMLTLHYFAIVIGVYLVYYLLNALQSKGKLRNEK